MARWLGGAAPESESEPESEMAGPAPEATPRVETPPAEVMDAEAVAPDAMAAEAMAPDVLDVEAGMRTANGDAGFYARMLQRFETSPATDLDALASLIDAGDSATAHRQAHSLKGMCASIGATRLHTLMRDIELALKEEKANVAQALLPAARAGLAALRECVARYSMG
jgi:HPt (histidine-containing phosphotransfer) domain-containing protein